MVGYMDLCNVQIGSRIGVMGDATGIVGVVKDEAGVDGTGTGCAWEAVEGCETHGSVERSAVLDGAY